MVASVEMRNPGWCDGVSMDAVDIRLVDISAILSGAGASSTNQLGVGSGVRPGPNSPMLVAVATGLSVTVNPGFALVQSTTATNGGTYSTCCDTAATLTCQAADLVNARIDSVCVTVTDNGDDTSTAVLQIITGTAAPSPSAPSLPANSTLLCNVTVPANASSLSSGNLADKRSFATAAGGIKLVLSSAMYPSAGQGSAGDHYYDLTTGRELVFDGTSMLSPAVALFAPASAGPATVSANSTTFVTVVSTTVTADGHTPVEIVATYKDINTAGTSGGNACTLILTRDGSMIGDGMVKTCTGPDSTPDGGTIMTWDTPPAGSHTYALRVANQGAGIFQVNSGHIYVKALSR